MPRRAGRVAEISFAEYTAPAARVVLDTHAWVGYLDRHSFALSTRAVRAVSNAQREGGMLVPDAAIWEIVLKAGRGSMRLQLPLRGWLARACEVPGTRLVPFTRELMLRTTELPAGAPSDPFDRAVIVTAIAVGAPLVTADRAIIAWAGATGAVRIVLAR